jgi:hypothetical protein
MAGYWWLMPVIFTTWEAEIRKIVVRSQPGHIVPETQSWKYPSQKKAGGVAQGVGPEFKPRTSKKKKKKKRIMWTLECRSWFQVLTLPWDSCVNFDKLGNLSEFTVCETQMIISTFKGCCEQVIYIKCLSSFVVHIAIIGIEERCLWVEKSLCKLISLTT